MKRLILIALICLMTFEKIFAIKCYQCQSVTDSRCDDYLNLPYEEAVIDCDYVEKPFNINYTATFCRKIKQKFYDNVRITRSCGFLNPNNSSDHCKKSSLTAATMSEYCECHSELCNGGTSIKIYSNTQLLITIIVSTLSLFGLLARNFR